LVRSADLLIVRPDRNGRNAGPPVQSLAGDEAFLLADHVVTSAVTFAASRESAPNLRIVTLQALSRRHARQFNDRNDPHWSQLSYGGINCGRIKDTFLAMDKPA
jgi:hypothetical protein